jgi:gamma-glutamyltranspeptidase / glutathione hydrolase
MAPAISLAEDGYILSSLDADFLSRFAKTFATQENVAAIFLNDGRPWREGERFSQKQLGATLRTIASDGPAAFYEGRIADAIAAASLANGGLLSKQDLTAYRVVERPPLTCSYRGYQLIVPPPPGSGGIALCEILAILEGDPMADLGFHSAAGIQLMVEAMRHAFVDRNFLIGDPAFVTNPVERLLSQDYAARIRAAIPAGKASRSKDVQAGVAPHESTETAHFSVINNEMDDFTVKPGAANMFGLVQGKRNAIAPGKRPVSSMTPTVVVKDGETVMVLGSPGGSRIITTVMQVLMNVIDHDMDIQEAVDAPRIHHQWMPDNVFAEPRALSPDTAKMLRDMGYEIEEQAPWSAAEAILVVSPSAPADAAHSPAGAATRTPLKEGMVYGAADNRRPAGAAMGDRGLTP